MMAAWLVVIVERGPAAVLFVTAGPLLAGVIEQPPA